MEKTAEETYTDLLRQIGSPTIVEPDVLIGYLRDVERLQAKGHITPWQLDRARSAYQATLDRDPRQRPAVADVGSANVVADPVLPGTRNLDPISGTPGAHPLGTGLGAAAAGAATGAVAGTVAGPVGTLIGTAIGAVVGGLAGKGVAELIDPTVEDAYWRDHYTSRPYAGADASYDDYGPAYRHGVNAYRQGLGRSFEEAEGAMSRGWDAVRGTSQLAWERARDASRDAWERVDRAA